MKHSKSIILVLIFIFVAVSALRAQTTQDVNTDDSKIALQGYSPVSYVDLNLAQRGTKSFKSEHNGFSYYFINAEQKATFDANPQKYLPQFGGWCATGIAVGAKFRTDPNKFLVRGGKLYLFLYDLEVDAKQLWLKDEKGMEKKARENWQKMAG